MNEREDTVNALSRIFTMIFGVFCTLGTGIVGGWTMRQCTYDMQPLDTLSVRTDTIRDTIYKDIRDSLPPLAHVRPAGVVTVKVPVPYAVPGDTVHDTIDAQLEVVQKEYRRDSLYTAWVSGIQYMDLPRLDSISFGRQTVTQYVTRTITVMKPPSRFVVAVTAGAGIDPTTGKISPCIAIGGGYRLW